MILQMQDLKKIKIINKKLQKPTFCRVRFNQNHQKKCKNSIKINLLKIRKYSNNFSKV